MRWVFTESRVEEPLNCVASYTFLAFIYKKFKLGFPNWMCLCSSKFFPKQSSCFSPIPASEGGHAPAAKFKHLLRIINQFSVLEFSYRFQIPSRILRSSRLQRVQRLCHSMLAEDSSCSSTMRLKILQPLESVGSW